MKKIIMAAAASALASVSTVVLAQMQGAPITLNDRFVQAWEQVAAEDYASAAQRVRDGRTTLVTHSERPACPNRNELTAAAAELAEIADSFTNPGTISERKSKAAFARANWTVAHYFLLLRGERIGDPQAYDEADFLSAAANHLEAAANWTPNGADAELTGALARARDRIGSARKGLEGWTADADEAASILQSQLDRYEEVIAAMTRPE